MAHVDGEADVVLETIQFAGVELQRVAWPGL